MCVFAFGAHVLVRRASRVTIAFFAMAAAAAAWQAAFTMMYLAVDPAVALLWAKLAYVPIPFIAPAAYQFTVEMLRVAHERRIATRLGWALAAQFAVLAVATSYLVVGVRHFWWGYYPRYNGIPSVPYLLFFFGFLIAAAYEFAKAHQRSRGLERTRIRLLATAYAVACIASFDYLAVYGVPLYPFGYVGLLGYIAIAAYTVRRYDLVAINPSLAANEIISTMNDVLFVTDRDGRIQFANEAALTLLGYESDEIHGRQLEELLVPVDETGLTLRGRSIRDTEDVGRAPLAEPVHDPVLQLLRKRTERNADRLARCVARPTGAGGGEHRSRDPDRRERDEHREKTSTGHIGSRYNASTHELS